MPDPYRGREFAAPLINKPKKRTTTWRPPSLGGGIPHTVEGFSEISKTVTSIPRRGDLMGGDNSDNVDMFFRGMGTDRHEVGRESKAYDAEIARYERFQEARKRIKPSIAPEDNVHERRRTAARRRMRGRLGTLLSQRETLGATGEQI